MQEIINCLIEEVNRCRGLAKIPGIETFKEEYLHKAELLEKAAEIVKLVEEIGRRNLTDEQKTYVIGKMYEARKKTEHE